jgi:serine phosphatase RsbU (regulator of sigma subunit)
MFEDAEYEQRSFILDPGDVVVFHSDGIGDAQDHAGEFLGHAGLAKIVSSHYHLSADGLADKILEEVDIYSGGKHPADDRTLVVLKVK